MSKQLKALGKKYAEAIKNNPGKSMAARKARKTACLEYEAAVKEEKSDNKAKMKKFLAIPLEERQKQEAERKKAKEEKNIRRREEIKKELEAKAAQETK